MGEWCSRVVEKWESSWAHVGWALFVGFLLLPFCLNTSPFFPVILGVLGGLLLLWWLVDVVDQQVPLWMVCVGVIMLGIGFLPRGGLLSIACWIIYWTKVRE